MNAPVRLPVGNAHSHKSPTLAESQARDELLQPEENVLSTLRADGSRHWIVLVLPKVFFGNGVEFLRMS